MKDVLARTLIGMLCGTLTLTAFADHKNRRMQQIDTNEDGLISVDEFMSRPAPRDMIGDLDTDGDDAVSRDELNQHLNDRAQEMQRHQQEMQARLQQHFEDADADGNGILTREEAQTAAFNRLDTDDDGYLSREEMKVARHHRAPHAPGHRPLHPGGS